MSDTAVPAEAAGEQPNAPSDVRSTERSIRRRRRWSRVLAVIGAILLPIAGLALWSRSQLLVTDRYVKTVQPLASDPAVQAAVADRVATTVSDAVDFEHRAQDALPDRAKFLAAPIAAAARNFVHQVALNFLQSDQFEQLWSQVNRNAHDQVRGIITGKKTAGVQRENGKVVISLQPIAQQVLTRLDQVVPVDLSNVDTSRLSNSNIVLVDSKDLGRVQTGVKLFNWATYILLALAIVLLVASALLPRDKRSGMQRVGLAVTISMAVTLLAYRAGRSYYISNLPSEVTHPDAATAAFDIITRYVERGILTLLTLGVVLFGVAWILGPSRAATSLRGWWERLRNRGSAELAGVEPAPVALWVARHRNVLRFAVVALAVIALLLWEQPTGRVVLLLTLLTVLALAVISLIAGAVPVTDTATTAPADTGDAPATTPPAGQ
jgi:hypothetical protein